jgi:hypothetical protein
LEQIVAQEQFQKGENAVRRWKVLRLATSPPGGNAGRNAANENKRSTISSTNVGNDYKTNNEKNEKENITMATT